MLSHYRCASNLVCYTHLLFYGVQTGHLGVNNHILIYSYIQVCQKLPSLQKSEVDEQGHRDDPELDAGMDSFSISTIELCSLLAIC